MPKKYKYVNGNKMTVVNNYDLGTDVIPEEEQIVPDPLVTDVGKVLTVNNAGNPAWEDVTGFIALPDSPSNGDFLVYDSTSSAWVAQSLSTWTAGSY